MLKTHTKREIIDKLEGSLIGTCAAGYPETDERRMKEVEDEECWQFSASVLIRCFVIFGVLFGSAAIPTQKGWSRDEAYLPSHDWRRGPVRNST
jgi:hypothetical protein